MATTLGVAPAGCLFGGGGGSSNDDTAGDTDGNTGGNSSAGSADGGTIETDLDTCRGDASDAEVSDTIEIVGDYDQSLHEMVACGGLAVSLCAAIVDGVIDAIIAQSDDATPDGWTYQGEGIYFTDSAMADMQMRFYLAEDFEFGQQGDLVTENLFLVDSYLVNAYIDIDLTSGAAQIVYDAPGPLVELLGYGPNPPNPLPVDVDDLTSLKSKLRKLEFEGNVAVDDTQNVAIIRYDLEIPRMSAGALLDGLGMAYELQMASGSRADLDQQLTVDVWNIEFTDGSPGALDGNIDFHVDGQHFPFKGTMRYDASTYADPLLECP